MEREFIPYEQALALKELGFNEPCLGYYVTVEVPNPFLVTTKISDTQGGYFTFAPLYQQAFKWIRDNFYLVCIVFNDDGDIEHENLRYNWEIRVVTRSFKDLKNQRNARLGEYTYRSYEEAELECLKKLVEIIKKIKWQN